MKLTTWLVWTTLATAVLAQPFRSARLGQRLCLLQGQRVCWSRPLGDGKVQTLTPEGLALISRGKTWVVVEPSGREQCHLVVPESFKVESGWFDLARKAYFFDGPWSKESGVRLWVIGLENGSQARPATASECQLQIGHPQGDPWSLFREAHRYEFELTDVQLRALIRNSPWMKSWIVCWRAGRDPGAWKEVLRLSKDELRQAAWLLSDEQKKHLGHLAYHAPAEWQRLGEGFLEKAWSHFEMASSSAEKEAWLTNLGAYPGSLDSLKAPLLKVARTRPELRASAVALLASRFPLSELLEFIEDPVVLCRLAEESCPSARQPLVRMLARLKEADPARVWVLKALEFQFRRRLGPSYEAWAKCLEPKPAARLDTRDPLARILWSALSGHLRAADLAPLPRLRMRASSLPWMDQEGRIVQARLADCPWPVVNRDPEQGQFLTFEEGQLVLRKWNGSEVLSSWSCPSPPQFGPLGLNERWGQFHSKGQYWSSGEGLWSCRDGKAVGKWPGLKLEWIDDSASFLVLKNADQRWLWKRKQGKMCPIKGIEESAFSSYSLSGDHLICSSTTAQWVADLSGEEITFRDDPYLWRSPDGQYGVNREKKLLDLKSDTTVPVALDGQSWGIARDAAELYVSKEEEIAFYELPSGRPLGSAPWRRDWGQHTVVERGHLWQWEFLGDSCSIYQLRSPEIRVNSVHQRLLSELWTGYRIQGGLLVPLSESEFSARVGRWKSLGGGDWTNSPCSFGGPPGNTPGGIP